MNADISSNHVSLCSFLALINTPLIIDVFIKVDVFTKNQYLEKTANY